MKKKYLTFDAYIWNCYFKYVGKEGVYKNSKNKKFTAYDAFNPNPEQVPEFLWQKLLYTHCHIDHVLGNHFVLSQYNIPAYCHSLEVPQFISVPAYAPMYGFNKVHIGEPPTLMLNECDEISFGTTTLHCIFAPGHSPGSICFYNKKENVVIGGDVLFRMSIGRTDLPGGNHNLLLKNIREKLFTLPNDTTVYAGHMEPTTIGFEKENNPFL